MTILREQGIERNRKCGHIVDHGVGYVRRDRARGHNELTSDRQPSQE